MVEIMRKMSKYLKNLTDSNLYRLKFDRLFHEWLSIAPIFQANLQCDALNLLLSANRCKNILFIHTWSVEIALQCVWCRGEIYNCQVCNYHVQNVHKFLIKYVLEDSVSFQFWNVFLKENLKGKTSDIQKSIALYGLRKCVIFLKKIPIPLKFLENCSFSYLRFCTISCMKLLKLQFDTIKVNTAAREAKMK